MSMCCFGSSLTNFERFLQCVTPMVPSKFVSQSCIGDLNPHWQPLIKEPVEYFTLKDMWECYNEWSAFGTGTNVMLENGETVMQYFVPYLSSIHIYCSDKSVAASRNRKEEGGDGVEIEIDTWSDDSGSENLSPSLSNSSSKSWDVVSEESTCDQDRSLSKKNRFGQPYLQYTEVSSPYQRVPFVEKIAELAKSYPALMTLKSVDLSPASWMAVAWYPIYSIPCVKNEKDLETCFLTYHTLSSSFQDNMKEYEDIELGKAMCCCCGGRLKDLVGEKTPNGGGFLSVPPFGVATYKMQGDIWLNPDSFDAERLAFHNSAAGSWLKQLNLHQHDFNFFTIHSSF